MSRYFTRPRAAIWIGDGEEAVYRVDGPLNTPTVCDHEATDTGLLDKNGDPIMKAPRSIGFGRRDEW